MTQMELTEKLIEASRQYYNEGQSFLSDLEFDRQLEQLRKMEAESGTIYPNSPTQNVGAKVDGLMKVKHEFPALSLSKVKYKDRETLKGWLGDKIGVLSLKLDGLTVVLTYDNGKLTQAATRGDGFTGSDVTHNAKFFRGVPQTIPYTGHLVVRGEAMMTNGTFQRVNAEAGGIYENARNLAAASIQLLDSNISRQRGIIFKAFKLVVPEVKEASRIYGEDAVETVWFADSEADRLFFLEELGFDIVPFIKVSELNDANISIEQGIEMFKESISTLEYPTDGLVLSYEDQFYAESIGNTGHHPRGSVAMKWTDETVETTIRDIEWSVGKTGLITPVAIFDTVRLGLGSNVRRASLHNLSIMEGLNVKIGAKADVYLANMIIPQLAECNGDGTEVLVPTICPVCGGPLTVKNNAGIKTLHCTADDCGAKIIGKLVNAVSKDGLNINGLAESQIIDLFDAGLINEHLATIYHLDSNTQSGMMKDIKEGLLKSDGWGDKSWNNLIKAIDESRKSSLVRLLYALNIPLLGKDLAKKLSAFWRGSADAFMKFVDSDMSKAKRIAYLTAIDGIGEEKAGNIVAWCEKINGNAHEYVALGALISALEFDTPTDEKEQTLAGMTFVITGSVYEYKNRDEFKASVEARGGKVAGSVSKNTDFLVNNDIASTSGKNAKAKELNIPIISEDEFISRFGK